MVRKGSVEQETVEQVLKDKKVFIKWMIRNRAPSGKEDVLGERSCGGKNPKTKTIGPIKGTLRCLVRLKGMRGVR